MNMRWVGCVCVPAWIILSASLALAQQTTVFVVRGYGGQVYSVVDSPSPSPLPSSQSKQLALCATLGNLELGITPLTPPGSTDIDNSTMLADHRFAITIGNGTASANGARTTRAIFNRVRQHVGSGSTYHAYILQNDRPAPFLGITAKDAKSASDAPPDATVCEKAPAATTVLIPWSTLALHFGSNFVSVGLTTLEPNIEPSALPPSYVTVVREVRVLQAFPNRSPSESPSPLANSHQLVYFTQGYQLARPATTSPPQQTVLFEGQPYVLNRLTATKPSVFNPPFPPFQAEANLPLSQYLNFAGASYQTNSAVQTIQSQILSAATKAMALPSSSPLPSLPCSMCLTFQKSNAGAFSIANGSSKLSLSSTSLGSDDSPFSVGTLPDLAGAVSFSNSSDDGSLVTSVLQAFPENSGPPYPYSDSAIGFVQQSSEEQLSFLHAFVNRALPSPVPAASPSAPTVGPVYLPHLATSAMSVSNDWIGPVGTGAADLTLFGRLAYDWTDSAANAFGGAQYKYTAVTKSGTSYAGTEADPVWWTLSA